MSSSFLQQPFKQEWVGNAGEVDREVGRISLVFRVTLIIVQSKRRRRRETTQQSRRPGDASDARRAEPRNRQRFEGVEVSTTAAQRRNLPKLCHYRVWSIKVEKKLLHWGHFCHDPTTAAAPSFKFLSSFNHHTNAKDRRRSIKHCLHKD